VYTRVSAYDLFLKQAICSLSDFPPSFCVTLPTGEGTFVRQDTGNTNDNNNGGGAGAAVPTAAPMAAPVDAPVVAPVPESAGDDDPCEGGIFICFILRLLAFLIDLFT
jgi:hypothetical protein